MSRLLSTKFIRLLKTFDPEEIKAFEGWLRSPWCNTNKNLIRLLGKLKKYYPEFSDRKLSKEKLFHQVLPDGKFSDRSMNNLLSEGYLAAERFLIFQRFSKNDQLQQSLLIGEMQARDLNDWFFKLSDGEIGRLEAKGIMDWEDHLDLYQLYRTVYHHPDLDTRMQPGSSSITSMEQQLDLVYLLEKAAIINEKISRSRVLKGEKHEVRAAIKKWELVTEGIFHPAIELYKLRFAYTETNRWTQYQHLRKQVMDQLKMINEKEQKIHLISLINDSMHFVKTGDLDITALLPVYQLGLETGVLLNQGKISRSTYTMVVIMSNTKGDFDYTRDFINQFTGKLNDKIREDCYHWAKAHTAYWAQDLETSLNILQLYVFKAVFFQLFGRILLTQVYFDLYLQDDSYQFLLFNHLDTFEKWLNREQLWSKQNKVSFLRFVQKCRALVKYHGAIDFKPEQVETLLENESNIQALNWLKQKKEAVLRLRSKN